MLWYTVGPPPPWDLLHRGASSTVGTVKPTVAMLSSLTLTYLLWLNYLLRWQEKLDGLIILYLDEREMFLWLLQQAKIYFSFPGELLMRMLKMLILPLITSRCVAHLRTAWTSVCFWGGEEVDECESLLSEKVLEIKAHLMKKKSSPLKQIVRSDQSTDQSSETPKRPGLRSLAVTVTWRPLCSLMSGLSSMESKACCRMGVLTVTYYLWTTFIAVVVGIVLVVIIKPGVGTEMESNRLGGGPVMTSADALLDLIRWDFLSVAVGSTTNTQTCCLTCCRGSAANTSSSAPKTTPTVNVSNDQSLDKVCACTSKCTHLCVSYWQL